MQNRTLKNPNTKVLKIDMIGLSAKQQDLNVHIPLFLCYFYQIKRTYQINIRK